MNAFRNLIGAAVLVATMPVSAAEAFVQHLGDVTKSPVIAFASGPGYMLSADLLAGEFKILAEASPSVPTNNNFSGTLHPYEFTNTTGFTITVPAATPPTAAGGATGLQAHVHADLIAGPPVGTAIGGASNTNMRVSGNLFVRILGGAGQGDFLAYGFYQENVIYNVDGTIREFIPDFDTVERNGARVMIGGGGGISVNMDLLMPELVLDPGARLQLSFVGQGDASDSSTTDAWNTSRLSFILPFGVTLDNDIGQPLAWVTNAAAVPEPESLALMGLGLGFVVAFARRQRSGVLAARR